MKYTKYIITFLVCVSLTLETGVIYLSNQKAGDSLDVSEKKEQIAKITEENRLLKKEVLKYSSLKNIASKAAELGFTQDTEFISLDKSDTIASR